MKIYGNYTKKEWIDFWNIHIKGVKEKCLQRYGKNLKSDLDFYKNNYMLITQEQQDFFKKLKKKYVSHSLFHCSIKEQNSSEYIYNSDDWSCKIIYQQEQQK